MTQPARTPLLLLALTAAGAMIAATLWLVSGGGEAEGGLVRQAAGVTRGASDRGPGELASGATRPGAPAGSKERSAVEVEVAALDPGTVAALEDASQVVGRLLSSGAEPLEGAELLFTTRRSDLPLGYDLDLRSSLGSSLGSRSGEPTGPAISRKQRLEWEIAGAESSSDGSFEVPSGEGTASLRAGSSLDGLIRAPGHAVLRLKERRMPSERPLDLGELSMEAGAAVSGRVVGPGGEPAPGVRMSFGQPFVQGAATRTMPSRGIDFGVTDEAGAFRLDELRGGAFYLVAESSSYPTARFEGTARLDAPLERVTIRLGRGAVLQGRIDGAPAGVPLAMEARQLEVDEDRAVEQRPRYALVDPKDRTFVLRGLSPGQEVQLRVLWGPGASKTAAAQGKSAGEPVSAVERVTAFPGKSDLVMTWSARRSVAGRVLFSDPKSGELRPLESYIVSAASEPVKGTEFDARPLDGGDGPKLHHPGGRFLYADLPLRRDMSQAAFRVRAPGYGDLVVRNVPVPAGEAVDVGDWVLEAAPSMEVTVKDAGTGALVQGARLYLVSVSNERWFERWWKQDEPAWSSDTVRYGETGPRGVARLPLPGGGTPWKIGVQADGFVPPEPMVLGAAVETLEVEISRGAELTVIAVDPAGSPLEGATIHAGPQRNRRGRSKDDLPNVSGRTGADGRIVFRALPPGNYVARGQAPSMSSTNRNGRGEAFDWPESPVQVPEAGEVEVSLTLPHRVRVEGFVLQGGAPLADARVAFYVESRGQLMQPDYRSQELRAITDGSGRFVLESVPVHKYLAGVTHRSRAMITLMELEVLPPDEAALLDPFVLDLPAASVTGRVVYKGTDTPVPGALVRVSGPDGHPDAYVGTSVVREQMNGEFDEDDKWEQPSRTHTDALGDFALHGLAPGLGIRLTVSGDLFVSRSQQLEPLTEGGAHDDLRIEVEAAARVVVAFNRLGDTASGRRRRNRTRVIMDRLDKNGEAINNQRREQRGQGSTTFRSLLPGTYRFQTFGPGSGSGAADSTVVELAAGDDLRLEMRGD